MTAYKFVTTTTFDKEFKKLDKSIQKIIAKYIKINLINSTNPFLKGKALTANLKGIWRYRIMNYRLLVEIKEDKFIIKALSIGHRREIYNLKWKYKILRVIKNIKQSEKSALIVLKEFNEEIFKEISKDIEPAIFSEFFEDKELIKF